ncbi:MAG TPA: hypothetical protein VET87_24450 [Rubrivivax sp.]|nr:hypothetical protein [Rubrivivax sp.]
MMYSHASHATVQDFSGLASAAARVRDYPASRLVQDLFDPDTGDWHAILVIEHIVRQWAGCLRSTLLGFRPVQEDVLLDIKMRMERELSALQLLLRELTLLRSGPVPLSSTRRGVQSLVLADRAHWTEDRPMASGWYWHSRGPSWWRHGPIAILVDQEQSVWAPGQTKRIPLMFLEEWDGLWLGPFDGPQISGHRLAS